MARIRVGLVLTALLSLATAAHAAPEDRLGAEIDSLLSPLSRGPSAEAGAERLRPFGEEAVVRLVLRYEASELERRRVVPAVLCHLGGDRALSFVLALVRDRPEAPGVDRAIRAFPVEQEDRLVPLLVQRLDAPRLEWEARVRLQEAIGRRPTRAGLLVRALRDEPEGEPAMRRLHEVLGNVAGYAGHWYVIEAKRSASSRHRTLADYNSFWRAWWQRNGKKSRLAWLDEPLAHGGGPRSSAAQVLADLADPAATSRLVGLLDDSQRSVRYWAVVGLRALEGTLPEEGYLSEIFDAEEAVEIPRLKKVFGD